MAAQKQNGWQRAWSGEVRQRGPEQAQSGDQEDAGAGLEQVRAQSVRSGRVGEGRSHPDSDDTQRSEHDTGLPIRFVRIALRQLN